MDNNSLENLKKFLESPENISEEQMNELLENSLNFLNKFSNLMKNPGKENQEQILKDLEKYKEDLEKISQEVKEKTGMNLEDLAKDLPKNGFPGQKFPSDNPMNFLPELSKEEEKNIREVAKTMYVFGSTVKTPQASPKQNNEPHNTGFPKKV